eukprot:GGOE01010085.1.p6 GENE.GGOE01010085.1~~GGOE01010085.1.p6  ORF type:complete len:109 (-),score=1.01 GGOE01010085.1:841-1167(-)
MQAIFGLPLPSVLFCPGSVGDTEAPLLLGLWGTATAQAPARERTAPEARALEKSRKQSSSLRGLTQGRIGGWWPLQQHFIGGVPASTEAKCAATPVVQLGIASPTHVS